MIPCVLFEDERLLVVNKPAGLNTHAPDPHAGEGIYDWLRHREPRWARLASIHRLDKETSGLMVFGKTPLANRSLTGQFSARTVHKKYFLLTDRPVPEGSFTVESAIVRAGAKYLSRPIHAGGDRAETRFRAVKSEGGKTLVEAEPVTGRTHQIRVHAAERGFPILGDSVYGGTAGRRLCLHAGELCFQDPADGRELRFISPFDFEADPGLALRAALIDPNETTAFRLIHGVPDGWPGWQVDRFGDYLIAQSEAAPNATQTALLDGWRQNGAERAALIGPVTGVYHKALAERPWEKAVAQASPQLRAGTAAPDEFTILENGLRFAINLKEGASVGLFLDQRDNRRRLLTNHIGADTPLFRAGAQTPELLNAFAYTCAFSVCAAKAGARVTSLDLSKKYLDWGRRDFALNELSTDGHDFIFGDVFVWLRRLAGKGRSYDAILLDPPTFSRSKESGPFQAERDFGKLVAAALPALKPHGVLFASSNAARWAPQSFLDQILAAIDSAGRRAVEGHYFPQPPDFPINRQEPAYLKTVWLRVA